MPSAMEKRIYSALIHAARICLADHGRLPPFTYTVETRVRVVRLMREYGMTSTLTKMDAADLSWAYLLVAELWASQHGIKYRHIVPAKREPDPTPASALVIADFLARKTDVSIWHTKVSGLHQVHLKTDNQHVMQIVKDDSTDQRVIGMVSCIRQIERPAP